MQGQQILQVVKRLRRKASVPISVGVVRIVCRSLTQMFRQWEPHIHEEVIVILLALRGSLPPAEEARYRREPHHHLRRDSGREGTHKRDS